MATRETHEEHVLRIMNGLQCTKEEAEDVIKWDKVIDQGGRTPYDLDPEAEKMAKKMANVKERKKPTNYNFSKRERKANPTKGGIIAEIAQFLTEKSRFATENVEITNKERMISFRVGEDNFEITLIQKRKPKN